MELEPEPGYRAPVYVDGSSRQGVRYTIEFSDTWLIRGFRAFDGALPIYTHSGDTMFLLPIFEEDEETAVLLALSSAGVPPDLCDRIWRDLYVRREVDWSKAF